MAIEAWDRDPDLDDECFADAFSSQQSKPLNVWRVFPRLARIERQILSEWAKATLLWALEFKEATAVSARPLESPNA